MGTTSASMGGSHAASRVPPLRFEWQWRLMSPPEEFWRHIADTERLNRLLGLPAIHYTAVPLPHGGSRVHAEGRVFGLHTRWVEFPFEFVEPWRYSVLRQYESGPVEEMLAEAELEPADGGTRFIYRIRLSPRWRLAVPLLRQGFQSRVRQRFDRAVAQIEAHLEGQCALAFDIAGPGRPAPLPPAFARLHDAWEGDPALVERLADLVYTAPDPDLSRLRPLVVAEAWGTAADAVVRLFIHAARAGVLDLQWDLVCPCCRGAGATSRRLANVRARNYCAFCNVEYDAYFDQSVEATFRPSEAVRRLEERRYCIGGPRNTPHRLAQCRVEAGASEELQLHLPPGEYQARGSRPVQWAPFRVTDRVSPSAFRLTDDALTPVEAETRPSDGHVSIVRIENRAGSPALVAIERTEWRDDALTAARLLTDSLYRDLYGVDALAPGETIAVRRLAILFSDLVGSTALYEQMGDAAAYALVTEHFRVLSETVARYRGTVVKTLGDAVMAAFPGAGDAVAAALGMHRSLGRSAAGRQGLALKVGVHAGPCVAISTAGQPDYFGTAVNIAARLQAAAGPGEVVVSRETWADLGASASDALSVEEAALTLRGISAPLPIARLKIASG